MNPIVRYCAVLLVLSAAVPAFSDDQDKANKELAKVNAMAMDMTGRAVVSVAVSDMTEVKRADLVQQRKAMNLNYGAMYVAQELIKGGAKADDIAAQLKAGKTITQVANDRHANWKELAADAKKLNSKIDDCLFKHFLDGGKADKQRNLDDKYDIRIDTLAVDLLAPKPDLEAAGERFNSMKDRAAKAAPPHAGMDDATEQAWRSDHARNGPMGTPGNTQGVSGGNGSPGIAAPGMGGPN
jgi:uncharacterized cupredoxin-like copper-binding protein